MESKEPELRHVVYETEDEISFVDEHVSLIFPNEKTFEGKVKKITAGKILLAKIKYFRTIFDLEEEIREIALTDNSKEVAIMLDYVSGNLKHRTNKNINILFKFICKWGFTNEKVKLFVDWDMIKHLKIERKEHISVLQFPNYLLGINYFKVPNILSDHVESLLKQNRDKVLTFKSGTCTIFVLEKFIGVYRCFETLI